MRRGAAAGALVLLGAVLLGCSHTLAKDKYVSQATKVCDDSFHQLDVALAIITPQSTDQQAASFLTTQFVPIYQKRIDALRALTPPKGDEATVRSLLDDSAGVLAQITANPTAYVRADPFAALNPRWDSYGVPACGSRSGSTSS